MWLLPSMAPMTVLRFGRLAALETINSQLLGMAAYAVSPTVVKLFGKTEWFNHFWKARLDKMVATLQEQGYEDIPYND